MRIRAALVPLVLAATLAAPAPPASAAVGCGGVWPNSTWCTFAIPATSPAIPTQVAIAGEGFSSGRTFVRVTLSKWQLGGWVEVASCHGDGLVAARCSTTTLTGPGSYACAVSGYQTGKYVCHLSYA